jgi:hypothetical protein
VVSRVHDAMGRVMRSGEERLGDSHWPSRNKEKEGTTEHFVTIGKERTRDILKYLKVGVGKVFLLFLNRELYVHSIRSQ